MFGKATPDSSHHQHHHSAAAAAVVLFFPSKGKAPTSAPQSSTHTHTHKVHILRCMHARMHWNTHTYAWSCWFLRDCCFIKKCFHLVCEACPRRPERVRSALAKMSSSSYGKKYTADFINQYDVIRAADSGCVNRCLGLNAIKVALQKKNSEGCQRYKNIPWKLLGFAQIGKAQSSTSCLLEATGNEGSDFERKTRNYCVRGSRLQTNTIVQSARHSILQIEMWQEAKADDRPMHLQHPATPAPD